MRSNNFQNIFDEEDDISLPETFWGEIVYIKFVIVDMIKHQKNLKEKLIRLKRQIYFFLRQMKYK